MKDLLNLSEDYYSEEDFKFFNNKFSRNPLNKNLILSNFKGLYTSDTLINSIEDYLSNEEIEHYIREKFGNINIEEFLENKG